MKATRFSLVHLMLLFFMAGEKAKPGTSPALVLPIPNRFGPTPFGAPLSTLWQAAQIPNALGLASGAASAGEAIEMAIMDESANRFGIEDPFEAGDCQACVTTISSIVARALSQG